MGRLRGLADELYYRDFIGVFRYFLENYELLREFRGYLFTRLFNKHDASEVYNTLVRYGVEILVEPLRIKKLRESTARRLLRGYAALRDYIIRIKRYDIDEEEVNKYLRELRRIMPRNKRIKILDYEFEDTIIDKALKQLEMLRNSRVWYFIHLLDFYTGLRGTELLYLARNYPGFRKVYHGTIVIVELNFVRSSKKAYVTMFPMDLERYILEYMDTVGDNIIQNIRDKRGLGISIYRKVHNAILSETMREHEIKLLQGKLSDIDVKHYTKHIRRIAEKYHKAYKKYYYLISFLSLRRKRS